MALLLLIAVVAEAENMDSRISEAKSVTSSSTGKSYDALLSPSIGKAIKTCVPPGSTSPANLGNFTLVAYVAADGSTREIEVRPSTSISKCFAQKFSSLKMPAPPEALIAKNGVPIVVEMSIVK